MSTTPHNVSADEIARFLSSLYGLKVEATANDLLVCGKFGALASYVDSSNTVQGTIVCELGAAAILGAALTQIPMGAVEDAVDSGKLPENLRENLVEVFNIAVNLFPSHISERLVLHEVEFDNERTPDEALSEVSRLELDMQRYGKCNLFLHSCE